MPHRLGSLVLVLVSSTAVAAPPPEFVEPPIEGPIEGPALPPPKDPPSEEPPGEEPPSEAPPGEVPPPSIEFAEGNDIEFATPPPDPSASYTPPSVGQEIGRAPDSGASFLAGGLWVIPISG